MFGNPGRLSRNLDRDTPWRYDKKCFWFGPILIFLRISGRARVYRAVYLIKLFSNLATFRPSVLPWLFVPAFRPGFLFRLFGLAFRFGLQTWSGYLVWRFVVFQIRMKNVLATCKILYKMPMAVYIFTNQT